MHPYQQKFLAALCLVVPCRYRDQGFVVVAVLLLLGAQGYVDTHPEKLPARYAEDLDLAMPRDWVLAVEEPVGDFEKSLAVKDHPSVTCL